MCLANITLKKKTPEVLQISESGYIHDEVNLNA